MENKNSQFGLAKDLATFLTHDPEYVVFFDGKVLYKSKDRYIEVCKSEDLKKTPVIIHEDFFAVKVSDWWNVFWSCKCMSFYDFAYLKGGKIIGKSGSKADMMTVDYGEISFVIPDTSRMNIVKVIGRLVVMEDNNQLLHTVYNTRLKKLLFTPQKYLSPGSHGDKRDNIEIADLGGNYVVKILNHTGEAKALYYEDGTELPL